MANQVESKAAPAADIGGLEDVIRAAERARGRGLPPVEQWNPPYCGDIGLKIARDGGWYYRGGLIARPALVKLFASILRRDPERYVLCTPVEKIAIEVEDAPFLAVEMKCEGGSGARRIGFRTNVDDWVEVGAAHPLRFETGPSNGLKPYALVRGGLWALATRAVFYDLVELGETRVVSGQAVFGVESAGQFFAICPAGEIEGLS